MALGSPGCNYGNNVIGLAVNVGDQEGEVRRMRASEITLCNALGKNSKVRLIGPVSRYTRL